MVKGLRERKALEVVIRPTLKAYLAEITVLVLSLLAILSAPLVPKPYSNYWYAIPLLVIVISYFASKRAFLLSLPPLVVSMIFYNLFGPLHALIGAVLVVIEFYVLTIYVKSIKYVLSEEGLVISVEFPLYSKVRSIPRNVIGEVTVETNTLGKLMGYSEIIIKLRSGEEVRIEAVPKELAEKARELIT